MESNLLTSPLLLVLVFVAIFYFLVFLPQKRQQNAHKQMLSELKKGDKVLTNGGFIVHVVSVEENFIKVELSDKVIVKLSKEYVVKKIDEK